MYITNINSFRPVAQTCLRERDSRSNVKNVGMMPRTLQKLGNEYVTCLRDQKKSMSDTSGVMPRSPQMLGNAYVTKKSRSSKVKLKKLS